MKTVILCGGMGTRLAEETGVRPKPMVTIGGHPILWHIMSFYAHHGFDDFVLALGYKGSLIKEYFLDFYALNSDFRVDLSTGKVTYDQLRSPTWQVQLVSTGEQTMTGGRLLRLQRMMRPQGTFMLTYGDGVSNIDLKALLKFHMTHGKLATVTTVRPSARFGGIGLDGDTVISFKEKPQSGEGWINGGFFVMEPEVFDYLDDDQTVLEGSPMERLVRDGQLMAYRHEGFWQCMDTVRDRQLLDELWRSKEAPCPWKIWSDE